MEEREQVYSHDTKKFFELRLLKSENETTCSTLYQRKLVSLGGWLLTYSSCDKNCIEITHCCAFHRDQHTLHTFLHSFLGFGHPISFKQSPSIYCFRQFTRSSSTSVQFTQQYVQDSVRLQRKLTKK